MGDVQGDVQGDAQGDVQGDVQTAKSFVHRCFSVPEGDVDMLL